MGTKAFIYSFSHSLIYTINGKYTLFVTPNNDVNI